MKMEIPEGYQPIMPYLIIENAPAFSIFMQTVFGAREKYRAMRDENLVMHAELSINGGTIMFADSNETYAIKTAGLFIYVNDCDAVYQKALENGAKSVLEPNDQPYGRTSGVNDPFGNTWWITSVI